MHQNLIPSKTHCSLLNKCKITVANNAYIADMYLYLQEIICITNIFSIQYYITLLKSTAFTSLFKDSHVSCPRNDSV